MPTIIRGNFEWDEAKNKLNIENHGISFEKAVEIYESPVLEYELVWKGGETRNLAVGETGGKCYLMVYAARRKRRRIISIRRTRDYETEAYEDWKKRQE